MIGLIGAMAVEVEALEKKLEGRRETTIGMDTFVSGKLFGQDAGLAVCGPGKVNAAVCTQKMITAFSPDWVLNLGVAGAGADGVRIGRGCQLYAEGGTLDMGEDAALSPGVTVDASGGLIRIGKQVAIGPGTVLRAANHCFDSLEKPIMLQGHLYGEIVIEDDVWIAANCTITPGTRIGHGAVVGAGAVVTRDVEPYAIVGGVPARVIGSRRKD